MCDIIQSEKDGDVSLICSISGKEITIRNLFGTYCEDRCDMYKDVNSMISIMEFVGTLNQFKR